MTALEQYQRLEAEGIWRPDAEAQRREVVVSFGHATLILSDPRSEIPLSHWSLPAVTRLNPGQKPALYAPDSDDISEDLEIADPDMIAAIDQIHRAIERARPHPGRLRRRMMPILALLLILGLAWWLPDGLPDYAARIAPPAQQTAIGKAILTDMTRLTGPACQRPAGKVVAERLAGRLLKRDGQIVVLPGGFDGSRALPGGIVLVTPAMLERGNTEPAVVAGHILAASVTAESQEPLRDALRAAGIGATIRLLTRGALPAGALSGHGAQILDEGEPRPDEEPLLLRFATVDVSSEPYARDLDPSGETTLGLIEADPFRTHLPDRPILTTAEWQTLAAICDGPSDG